ncbi:hypothetical protein [Halodesulfovibrio aestuarii]|uniref:Uncharacterized protein n=1 Tax=Halodesulfovibrio aestuarii TaxID=126333 RepID=A0A8G2C7A1_9BACT|nr:hypothetical protein [Halodesulfovibrio aestuarii]SHI60205.1 hypothetical protein SAMN05660830_00427 [Halodesulfovibrio aestuarii]
MSMSEQDWKRAEEALSMFSPIYLKCDGYTLAVQEVRLGNRVVITWFVEGFFKGAWLLNDCEERRRFARCLKRYAYPTKIRTAFKKLSKKMQKEMDIDPDKRINVYEPNWTSFAAFKRHLKANNKEISIISLTGYLPDQEAV